VNIFAKLRAQAAPLTLLWATSAVQWFVPACSGNTEERQRSEAGASGAQPDENQSAGEAGVEPSSAGSPSSPGIGGEIGLGGRPGSGGASGQGAAAPGGAGAGILPLMGPAFIDFDCGHSGELPAPSACAECQQTSCRAEFAAALGADWRSGNADGPCRNWFSCLQVCSCNDQECYRSCLPKLSEAACEEAWRPIDACTIDSCQELCSSGQG
jgi:hypothetical protein